MVEVGEGEADESKSGEGMGGGALTEKGWEVEEKPVSIDIRDKSDGDVLEEDEIEEEVIVLSPNNSESDAYKRELNADDVLEEKRGKVLGEEREETKEGDFCSVRGDDVVCISSVSCAWTDVRAASAFFFVCNRVACGCVVVVEEVEEKREETDWVWMEEEVEWINDKGEEVKETDVTFLMSCRASVGLLITLILLVIGLEIEEEDEVVEEIEIVDDAGDSVDVAEVDETDAALVLIKTDGEVVEDIVVDVFGVLEVVEEGVDGEVELELVWLVLDIFDDLFNLLKSLNINYDLTGHKTIVIYV